MIEDSKGGEVSYSYNNTKLDYNISRASNAYLNKTQLTSSIGCVIKSSNSEDYIASVEFKSIKALLIEENLIYVTESIRKLLGIKKTNDLSCFNKINPNKRTYSFWQAEPSLYFFPNVPDHSSPQSLSYSQEKAEYFSR